ncbi:MAG: periplasmic heavy metal sensor [Caulobacteraceae bacterium]|nr:periplasmic heavy metal sensor [Caulobacteraceae bacterium]
MSGGLSRGLLLTLVLALVAAIAGTWIGARYIYAQRHQPSLHEFVHKDLQLSDQQKQRLEALEQDFAARRRAREAELRAANAELARAIQSRHEYSPEVQAAIDHFHHAMGELQKETILHVLAMRTVLTPEQAVEFDKRIGEALTEQAP